MEDVRVPVPNPFIAEWLISPICDGILRAAGDQYRDLYRVVVAKRTGNLASSAHVSTGVERDRLVAVMEVGDPVAYYAASHEFGTTGGFHPMHGAHDLNRILNAMGAL